MTQGGFIEDLKRELGFTYFFHREKTDGSLGLRITLPNNENDTGTICMIMQSFSLEDCRLNNNHFI